MTQEVQPIANPFALMLDPEAVFQAVERSERLARLKSRICRPLDKPQAVAGEEGTLTIDTALGAFDAMEDGEAIEADGSMLATPSQEQ